ncbi:MAG: hypothetical protein Q7T19_08155 [Caulobacter sp.]|nr:hypothetical protein [Caulobacter sp.]
MRVNSNGRLWPALTAITGLGVLGVTAMFKALPAVEAAGACKTDGAVIRFELATRMADLDAIFGAPGCQAKVIAAMDAVNHLDIAAYIPTYTAFCICAAIWLGGRPRAPLVLAAVALALVAFAADMVETTGLLRMTRDLAAAEPLLSRVSTAAWIKFGALALNALMLALICLRATPRRLLLGGLLVLPVVGTTLAWLDHSRLDLMTLGFALSWTPTMLLAIRETVWPRKVQE